MSKYIKLTSLVLFITVALTGFSIYKAQASSPHPELKIVTSEGKPEYIEPVHLLGFVYDSQMNSISPTIELKNGNVNYINDKSFLDRMDFSYDPQINDLITDYRSFMRGKGRRADQYLETEQHVIYTGMENDVNWNNFSSDQMTIAILDKETEDEEILSIDIGDDVFYFDVYATYVNYPILTLLVDTDHSSDNPETYIYTFDIENPSEGFSETINLTEETGNRGFYVGKTSDRTERFIILQTLRQIGVSEFDYNSETSGYFAYDTQTQEVIDIPLFEEKMLLFTDNDKLYVGKDLGEYIELYEMNVENQDINLLGQIEMANPTIGRDENPLYNNLFNQRMSILDGKLYAYGHEYTDEGNLPLFQITDINTQDTLFNGTIEPKDTDKYDYTGIDIIEFNLDPS